MKSESALIFLALVTGPDNMSLSNSLPGYPWKNIIGYPGRENSSILDTLNTMIYFYFVHYNQDCV